MPDNKIDQLLFTAAYIQDFTEVDDELTKLVNSIDDSAEELYEFELDVVSAAGKPNYESFLKKMEEHQD